MDYQSVIDAAYDILATREAITTNLNNKMEGVKMEGVKIDEGFKFNPQTTPFAEYPKIINHYFGKETDLPFIIKKGMKFEGSTNFPVGADDISSNFIIDKDFDIAFDAFSNIDLTNTNIKNINIKTSELNTSKDVSLHNAFNGFIGIENICITLDMPISEKANKMNMFEKTPKKLIIDNPILDFSIPYPPDSVVIINLSPTTEKIKFNVGPLGDISYFSQNSKFKICSYSLNESNTTLKRFDVAGLGNVPANNEGNIILNRFKALEVESLEYIIDNLFDRKNCSGRITLVLPTHLETVLPPEYKQLMEDKGYNYKF